MSWFFPGRGKLPSCSRRGHHCVSEVPLLARAFFVLPRMGAIRPLWHDGSCLQDSVGSVSVGLSCHKKSAPLTHTSPLPLYVQVGDGGWPEVRTLIDIPQIGRCLSVGSPAALLGRRRMDRVRARALRASASRGVRGVAVPGASTIGDEPSCDCHMYSWGRRRFTENPLELRIKQGCVVVRAESFRNGGQEAPVTERDSMTLVHRARWLCAEARTESGRVEIAT